MLQTIIDNLYAKVKPHFDLLHPLAEVKRTGDKKFPAVYNGAGNYSQVDIDLSAGVGYFRKNGQTTISPVESRGCDEVSQFRIPIRLVASEKKAVLGKDDEFSADAYALTLLQDLTEVNGTLKAALKANLVSVQAVAYETDASVVWNQEYAGIERQPSYEYDLIFIDLEVIADMKHSCIEIQCNTYCNG
jgi:hypothetical protein